MHDAKKRPRSRSRLQTSRRMLVGSLAIYLFAVSGVVMRAITMLDWLEVLLALASLWIPYSMYHHWRAWQLLDKMMQNTKETLDMVHQDHITIHPIALFVTQTDQPDAPDDIRQLGHGSVNIRELRN